MLRSRIGPQFLLRRCLDERHDDDDDHHSEYRRHAHDGAPGSGHVAPESARPAPIVKSRSLDDIIHRSKRRTLTEAEPHRDDAGQPRAPTHHQLSMSAPPHDRWQRSELRRVYLMALIDADSSCVSQLRVMTDGHPTVVGCSTSTTSGGSGNRWVQIMSSDATECVKTARSALVTWAMSPDGRTECERILRDAAGVATPLDTFEWLDHSGDFERVRDARPATEPWRGSATFPCLKRQRVADVL